jgi:hypothetical protein
LRNSCWKRFCCNTNIFNTFTGSNALKIIIENFTFR